MAGRRLYRFSEIDHEKLFRVASSVTGDVLLTYDDTTEVRGWASGFGFQTQSVAMRNRRNARQSELLVGRDLSWARGSW